MNASYLEGFVEECLDRGLTRAATARLVDQQLHLDNMDKSAAYAEGASAYGQALDLMAGPAFMVKSARFGLGRLAGAARKHWGKGAVVGGASVVSAAAAPAVYNTFSPAVYNTFPGGSRPIPITPNYGGGPGDAGTNRAAQDNQARIAAEAEVKRLRGLRDSKAMTAADYQELRKKEAELGRIDGNQKGLRSSLGDARDNQDKRLGKIDSRMARLEAMRNPGMRFWNWNFKGRGGIDREMGNLYDEQSQLNNWRTGAVNQIEALDTGQTRVARPPHAHNQRQMNPRYF